VFDNLLAEDAIRDLLVRDIEAGQLPASILLSGPPASGKLTAALEISRILSCAKADRRAAWSCSCPSCSRHRVLAHPDLLLFGPRAFPEEIPAALELLERSPGKASAFFFVRAIRKLEKRFDAALYEGEEARLAKAAPLIREIEERLDAFAPAYAPGPEEERSEKAAAAEAAAAKGAAAAAKKLEALVPDSTPIYWIRAAEVWAQLAANGLAKTLVIEEADRMNDGARNALLKMLEEPPRNVEFILVSSRRSALIGTVLSRVRPYDFKARSREESGLVIERIFRAPRGSGTLGAEAPSVQAFLAARRAFPPEAAQALAKRFLAAAIEERSSRAAEREDASPAARDPAIADLGSYFGGAEGISNAQILASVEEATKSFGQKDEAFSSSFRAFLEALAAVLALAVRRPNLGTDGIVLLGEWARLIRDARFQYEALNRSPSLLAESLLYAMEDA
jgi:DNA polymerase III subunit gamma/tau